MKKLSFRRLLPLVYLAMALSVPFSVILLFSSPSSSTIEIRENTRFRPNPTWRNSGLNTTYTMKATAQANNIAFPNNALQITIGDVGYWTNVTSGADAEVNVWKWFQENNVTLEYTTTGSFNSTVYVGSLGEPTVSGADSSGYANDQVWFTTSPSSSQFVTLFWSTPEWTPTPWVLQSDNLIQNLLAGDLLGFLIGLYTLRIGQLFYALIILLFTVPLYLRTRSLLFVSIVWILIGGSLIVAMPIVAPVAVLFLSLGLAGMLWKLFTTIR